MTLGGGQHARGFAIGLAEETFSDTCDQTMDGRVALHGLQEPREARWDQSEEVDAT